MDCSSNVIENSEPNSSEDRTPAVPVHSPQLAVASLALSQSTANFLDQTKFSGLFSRRPKRDEVPTQAFSLSRLPISCSSLCPPKISLKSTISANPLQIPFSLVPRRPSQPSNGAGFRRATIVWFRNDLRLHDNECLNSANNDSMSVLPVYCFDPRDYGKSSSATFVIESVSDLRKNLQAKGSNLVVRIGKPETVLVELAKEIGADAVYAHYEVLQDEMETEERVECAMKEENVEVKYFWGSTLYHIDDIPFKIEDMPSSHDEFKEQIQGLSVRKMIEGLDKMKGLPSRGDVEPGDIPSLSDLNLNQPVAMSKEGWLAPNTPQVGGETEALHRLKTYAAECRAQRPNTTNNSAQNSIYGATFSNKISPWLTTGCISPRSVVDELNKTVSRKNDGGYDTGTNWVMFELLWRDFFRFITKKCNSTKKRQPNPSPATASMTALA
ncbi:blue-light photoreceptor PHR2-like [Cucurbita moschata]|uniref:Blue-light photoreceptor PHR2-like n=1 Tax=Cucurbita moschata TaxID=3662 RepID=A0A6J1GP30_CUCMO|nr:blue-light photoreceptor PHR2-like [Cucurbita moschata]